MAPLNGIVPKQTGVGDRVAAILGAVNHKARAIFQQAQLENETQDQKLAKS